MWGTIANNNALKRMDDKCKLRYANGLVIRARKFTRTSYGNESRSVCSSNSSYGYSVIQ